MKAKKKICYVVTIPSTVRAFFIHQLQYLANNGFDVTVICSSDNELQHELGKGVHYIPLEIPRGLSLIKSLRAIRSLMLIFKREQFDLIQYSTPNAALYASFAAKSVGCKLRNYHLMGYRYLGSSGIGRLFLKSIEKLTCSFSTSIECVSKSNLEFGIKERLFTRENATVVWNGSSGGVDLNRFDIDKRTDYRNEIRKKYGLDDNDFVFGFVGRITKDKGINELLESFLYIDNAKLMIVGTIEDTRRINKDLLRISQGNKNIVFIDSVEDIEKYYAAIDMLVLPSYREGFGNVIIEAGAMGTPSIVSNIPGPLDLVVDNQTGIVVQVKSTESLLEGMKKSINADRKKMSSDILSFVRMHYDSELLNEHIYLRKKDLLKYE